MMGIRKVPNESKCHMRHCLLGALLLAASSMQAQVHPVEIPRGGRPWSSTRSAGVDAGDYVYISGQGGQHPDGSMPDKFEEQASQALENVKARSEEHTSELQSRLHLVCRLLLEKKKARKKISAV